jgi:hypothetical protein
MKIPIFISMTTVSTRLKTLDEVLLGLMRQTLKADRIILNVSIDPFMLDDGIRFEHLPLQARKWAVAGSIEVYFVKNTGPYRKIIPTLRRFSNTDFLVATVDDDVRYPPEWLEQLVDACNVHDAVAAYRCRIMEFEGANLKPYPKWHLASSHDALRHRDLDPSQPNHLLFPTGCDGVIYHSKHLKDLDLLCKFAVLAPGQDDIALRFLTLLYRVRVILAERRKTSFPNGNEFPVVSTGGDKLFDGNSTGSNDVAIKNVLDWWLEARGTNLLEIK